MIGEISRSFERRATSYGRYARVQADLAEWLADWLPKDRSGRALEVGAGTGVFTKGILPWTGHYLATDVSESMCQVGRLEVPEVDWEVMAAEKPLAGPWDWIFSSSMLQWIARPNDLFASWQDCLAPGGRIVAGLFVAGTLGELGKIFGEEIAPLVWRSPEEWRAALQRSGLRLLRDEAKACEYVYPSALDLLRSVHRVGAAPQRRLTPGALRRGLADYDVRFSHEGQIRATWEFYRFEVAQISFAV